MNHSAQLEEQLRILLAKFRELPHTRAHTQGEGQRLRRPCKGMCKAMHMQGDRLVQGGRILETCKGTVLCIHT